jgi:hypothetical protein
MKSVGNIVYMSTITNMLMVWNVEVITDKFNVVWICTIDNYTQKWNTELYNSKFTVSAVPHYTDCV